MRGTARLQRIDVWGSAFLASLGLAAATSACSSSVSDGPSGGGGATPTGGGGVGLGGSTASGLIPCVNPVPVVIDGVDTGYVICEGNWKHRAAQVTCPSLVPRPAYDCPGGIDDQCNADTDCAGENAYCAVDNFGPSCYCAIGCTSDDDCGGGVCECGDPVGHCVAAECTVDADCGGGALCAKVDTDPACDAFMYICQTPEDECAADLHCEPSGDSCTVDVDGKRICASAGCAIGRPFLVEGGERLALPTTRADWSADVAPELDMLSARTKKKLGEYWTMIGQMEHASIAAFARFSLQLLALGAPPELVVRSQTAMADETHHAQLAFALASAYLEGPVGPGPLDISGALADISVEQVLRTVIMEGCIGETVAAMEAKEALTYVTDPTLRYVFGEIARDESQHAMLAWRTVGWLCDAFGEQALAVVGDIVDGVRAALTTMPPAEPDAHDESLLALGFVSDKVRGELRRGATERVVLRGLEAIVCGAGIDPDVESSRMTLV